jgi:hypothetical protein
MSFLRKGMTAFTAIGQRALTRAPATATFQKFGPAVICVDAKRAFSSSTRRAMSTRQEPVMNISSMADPDMLTDELLARGWAHPPDKAEVDAQLEGELFERGWSSLDEDMFDDMPKDDLGEEVFTRGW